MLTLYHAPMSRSSAIVTLLDELGALDKVDIKIVSIPRMRTGTGEPDPNNPHPEKKVPYLVHGGDSVRERSAIVLYLTDLFPEKALGPTVGHAKRGRYLSWLAYYQGVMEPVYGLAFANLSHPVLTSTFRGEAEVADCLIAALSKGSYLLGDDYSAADLLLHGIYTWAPQLCPDDERVKAWVKRCQDRPSVARTNAYDTKMMG